MAYQVIKVTPTLAEQYLTLNTKNRKLRASNVDFLSDLIKSGEWRQTGEPIRFTGSISKTGKPSTGSVLLDGQHRLQAFLQSGKKTLMFEVLDGLKADAFQYMDQGRSRSAGDVLSIEGYKNCNVLAGVARTLLMIEKEGVVGNWRATYGGRRKASNHEILQYVRAHDKPIHHAIKEGTAHTSSISAQYTVHCSGFFLFKKKSAQDCEKFFYALEEEKRLAKDSPMFQYRSVLLDQRFSRKHARQTSIHSRELFIMLVIAWNYFRKGEKIKSVKILKEFDYDSLPAKIL